MSLRLFISLLFPIFSKFISLFPYLFPYMYVPIFPFLLSILVFPYLMVPFI